MTPPRPCAEVDGLRDRLGLERIAPHHRPQRRAFTEAFWDAVGTGIRALSRHREIVDADVLDAWFPPAPGVLAAVHDELPWLLRTLPPTMGDGLVRASAHARGLAEDAALLRAGSSALIYLSSGTWLTEQSRVLLLDAHEASTPMSSSRSWVPRSTVWAWRLTSTTTWTSTNCAGASSTAAATSWWSSTPRSPTGGYCDSTQLRQVLADVPRTTRIRIDKSYVNYVEGGSSLEQWPSTSPNVVVCTSMSEGVRTQRRPGGLPQRLPPRTRPAARAHPTLGRQLSSAGGRRSCAGRPGLRRRRLRRDRRPAFSGYLVLGGPWPACGPRLSELHSRSQRGPQRLDVPAIMAHYRAEGVFLRSIATTRHGAAPDAVRVAVKNSADNARMLATLQPAL